MARPQGVGTLAGLGLWLALALPARAEGLDLAPARACLERNAPKSSVSLRPTGSAASASAARS